MSHYAALPKLPVPSLGVSLDRLLCSLRPLLSPTEYSEAVRLTGVFSDRQGPYLQAKLARLAEGTDNWASHVWVQTRYLSNRSSLLLSNGVATNLQPLSSGSVDSILHSLSRFICLRLYTFQRIRAKEVPQDRYAGEPLCMEQYKSLFGVSRIPGPDRDTYSLSPDSRHIVVMHTGSVYKVPVCRGGEEGTVSVQEMYSLLSQVISLSEGSHGEGERAVGLLTALERDQWYSVRQQLMQSPTNRESLSAIEGSLFGVCLDEYEAGELSNDSKLKFGIFGDLKRNYFNRWFGLSRQSMVSADGYVSGILDHSLVDGSIGTRYKLEPTSIDPSYKLDASLKVELLRWHISPLVRAEIGRARIFVDTLYLAIDIQTFHFTDYGKAFMRSYNLNFQAYVQLAQQLSYYRLYHGFSAAYQPVSLRRFHAGRLEHPHTVTEESRAFVESMDRDCDGRERYELMRLAVEKHKRILSDTNQGQTYCKHMLALKMLAEIEGIKIELFEREFFNISTQHRLATNILPYMPNQLMSIHPIASRTGHIVLFQVTDAAIYFSVSTFLHPGQRLTSREFGAQIHSSLCEIQQLVVTQATKGMLSSKL